MRFHLVVLSISALSAVVVCDAAPPPLSPEVLAQAPYIAHGTVVQVERKTVRIDECRSVVDTVIVLKRDSAQSKTGAVADYFGKDLDFFRGFSIQWVCGPYAPTGGAFGVYGIDDVREGQEVTVHASDPNGWTRNIISPNGLLVTRRR